MQRLKNFLLDYDTKNNITNILLPEEKVLEMMCLPIDGNANVAHWQISKIALQKHYFGMLICKIVYQSYSMPKWL